MKAVETPAAAARPFMVIGVAFSWAWRRAFWAAFSALSVRGLAASPELRCCGSRGALLVLARLGSDASLRRPGSSEWDDGAIVAADGADGVQDAGECGELLVAAFESDVVVGHGFAEPFLAGALAAFDEVPGLIT
jgi:hypothetical protein